MHMKKICNWCNTEQDTANFRKDKSRHDGFAPYCKPCQRAHCKSLWKEKYKDRYKSAHQKRRDEGLQIINAAKIDQTCHFCSEADPVCLDFHHKDPSTKYASVSSMRTHSRDKLYEEINKCVLVCANCHRKLHAHGWKV